MAYTPTVPARPASPSVLPLFSAALLTGTLLLGQAAAQSDYSQVPSQYTSHVTLAPDASYDEDDEFTSIIRSQDDLQNASVKARSFISGLQQLTVADAYLIKPDGTHVPVGQDHIYTKDAPATQGYADFGDNKVVQVLFPGVAVGDRLFVKWHLHSQALFPGRYSVFSEVQDHGYPYASEVTVNAPKSLNLQAKARGLEHLTQKDLGDRVEFTLSDGLTQSSTPEANAECPCDYVGAGSISNFSAWADLARAYNDRAADKAAVTPEIRSLARQLTAGRSGLDAVRAVDAWVRSHVRYVQVYLDAGGYVPHTAASILTNLYGDCKDYVTLSQALLKAAGIESQQVLVSTVPRYQEIPLPGPAQFNHAILYVPSLRLYLNPTDRFAPLGAYWGELYGKPVLNADTGALTHFDASSAGANRYEQTAEYTLNPDGSLLGTMTARATGAYESDVRNALAPLTEAQAPQILSRVLSSFGEGGSGTLSFVAPFSTDDVPLFHATWTSPDVFTPDDVVSLRLPTGFTFSSFDAYKATVAMETRTDPLVRHLSAQHKVVTLHLPDGYSVLKLPKDAQADTPSIAYRMTYRQQGSDILADQELDFKQVLVQPADYPEYRATLLAALRAADAPILLQKK